MSTASFSSLSLSQAQLDNLESLGYKQMTPVQAASLPQVLEGKDLIVQAKTGSGFGGATSATIRMNGRSVKLRGAFDLAI